MRAAMWDRDAEVALLAAVFDSRVVRDRVRLLVTGGDFYSPQHEQVWQAMALMDARGVDVDQVTLREATGQKLNGLIADVITCRDMIPANAEHYAGIVQGWAVRRRMDGAARRVLEEARGPEGGRPGWSSQVAAQFAAIRDTAEPERPNEAVSLEELLAEPDVGEDWVVPSLLERGDRFMLTGEEGLGKSHLLRQIAVHAAGGVDPFDYAYQYEPVSVLIVDCENSVTKVRRMIRAQAEFVTRWGQSPQGRLHVANTDRLNLLRDRDIARVHRMIDDHDPALVVIGPLYRLAPGGLNMEEEAMTVLGALDTIRARGCALLVETHAGHETIGYSKVRNLRPRGSSALMGWPEFGYGLRRNGGEGWAALEKWRGDREARSWPGDVRRGDGFRWVPC